MARSQESLNVLELTECCQRLQLCHRKDIYPYLHSRYKTSYRKLLEQTEKCYEEFIAYTFYNLCDKEWSMDCIKTFLIFDEIRTDINRTYTNFIREPSMKPVFALRERLLKKYDAWMNPPPEKHVEPLPPLAELELNDD